MDPEIILERTEASQVLRDILRLYSTQQRELEGMGAHSDDLYIIVPPNGRQNQHAESDWANALSRIMDVVHEYIATHKAIWFRVWNADLIYDMIRRQREAMNGNA